MASNREERFQMRQRGAGTRQMGNLDFGITFPVAPLPAQRSGRRGRPSTQEQPPTLAPQRSSRKTPQPERLKLPSSRSSGSSRRAPRTSTYDIPQDDVAGESSTPAPGTGSQRGTGKKRRIIGPTLAAQLKKTTEKSSQQGSSDPRSSNVQGTVEASSEDVNTTTLHETATTIRNGNKTSDTIGVTDENIDPRLQEEPSPASTRRGRSRKSTQHVIGSGRRSGRKKDLDLTLQSQTIGTGKKRVYVPVPRRESPEEDEQEGISDEEVELGSSSTKNIEKTTTSSPQIEDVEQAEETSKKGQSNSKKRRRKSASARFTERRRPRPVHVRRSTETIVQQPAPTAVMVPVTRPTSPPNQSRPKKNTSRRVDGASQASASNRSRASQSNTVPITVHRLAQPQKAHDGKGSDEEDIASSAPLKYMKRGGVNAVDVLAQICRELVQRAAETIVDETNNERNESRRKAGRRKRKAIEAFGEELDLRLFEMTEALDNNYALTMRLRKAHKEKLVLRERLLELKRQREAVALDIDEVRRVHEKESRSAQEQDRLNSAMHDIELAVSRGRSQQAAKSNRETGATVEGLETILMDVVSEVGSKHHGGGLLQTVKDFNAFLEQTAISMGA